MTYKVYYDVQHKQFAFGEFNSLGGMTKPLGYLHRRDKILSNDELIELFEFISTDLVSQRPDDDEVNSYVVNPKWFGALGDGTTDDTSALLTMRNVLLMSNNTRWVLDFPTGDYVYTNNRWIRGIKYVHIKGNGSSFAMNSNNAYGRDNRWLLFYDPFDNYATDTTYPGNTYQNAGYKINTAAIGATTITLTTAADANNFDVGDLVIVHGFDQQGTGFPPNARFFEYRTLTDVNGTTGVLTFSKGLVNRYNSSWWDYATLPDTTSFGAARVKRCDSDTMAFTRNLVIENCTIKDNLISPVLFSISNIKDSIFRDVEFVSPTNQQVATGTFDSMLMERVIFPAIYQIDKLGNRLLHKSCIFNGSVNTASGINYCSFTDNCVFNDSVIEISPRHAYFDNCIFNNTKGVAGGTSVCGAYLTQWPIRTFTVKNSYVYRDRTRFGEIIRNPAGTITVTSNNGRDMLIAKAGESPLNTLRNIEPGSLLTVADGTIYGRVTDIIDYDATYLAVQGDWNTNPTAGEVYTYRLIQNSKVDNVYVNGSPILVDLTSGMQLIGGVGAIKLEISNDQINWAFANVYQVQGYIKSVWVHFFRDYTGASLTPRFRLQIYTPAIATIMEIPLTTPFAPDTAYMDTDTDYGPVGGTYTNASCMSFVDTMRILPVISGGTGFAGTEDQMPEVHITLEVVKPPQHRLL